MPHSMVVFELVKKGGWMALASLGLGGVALLFAVGALIALASASKRIARGVGIAAIAVAAMSASVGVVGMQRGLRTTDAALAEVAEEGGADSTLLERIRVEGFLEAQCAAKIGFGAAIVPFVLGAAAAIIASAKARQWTLTIVMLGVALVPIGGALLASTTSPHARYPFDPTDRVSWDLADARDAVEHDQPNACDKLDAALDEARQAQTDPARVAPTWQTLATRCARAIFADMKAHGGEIPRAPAPDTRKPRQWTADALLDSSLVTDDELRRELTAYAHTTFL